MWMQQCKILNTLGFFLLILNLQAAFAVRPVVFGRPINGSAYSSTARLTHARRLLLDVNVEVAALDGEDKASHVAIREQEGEGEGEDEDEELDDEDYLQPRFWPSKPNGLRVMHSWMHRSQPSLRYAHMSMVQRLPDGTIAGAFQCSRTREGALDQHLCLSRSHDGGINWSPHSVPQWGLLPIWGPVLHCDEDGKLWLFYSESRKETSPGGDVKYIISWNNGDTWSPPVTIYTTEHRGGVQKVTANKLADLGEGHWVLPVWAEPHDERIDKGRRSAFVLVTQNYGLTWDAKGDMFDPLTWLIEGAVVPLAARGSVLQFFRTWKGAIYSTTSVDWGLNWKPPAETELLNPDSKVCLLRHSSGTLLVAYNNSTYERTPLTLAESTDEGKTWQPLAVLEDDPDMWFAYPTMEEVDGKILVSYTVYGHDKPKGKWALPRRNQDANEVDILPSILDGWIDDRQKERKSKDVPHVGAFFSGIRVALVELPWGKK